MMTLLERDDVLAELSSFDRGRTVAIVGEAGIGKTSLLHEFANRCTDRVLRAGCEALFTPRPLGPLYDIAADLDLDVEVPREKLFPAALAAIAQVPTLLIIEDVHWADRATLDLVKYIARRIAGAPVVLAISYRDDEVAAGHPLVSLLGEAAVKRIRLTPLSLAAVEVLGGSKDLHEVTGGNPFFVTEALASPDRVPASVRDAVLARAATLTPAARHVIELASLMPGHADLELLGAKDEDVEVASRSGIVHIADDAIVFRHEISRRVIEDSLSDVRRRPMHRAILEKLDGGGSLARLAHHAVGARDAESILLYAPLAAEEAANASAHREAAAHYRNALAFSGSIAPQERASLLEALSYECYLTEQLEEALQRRIEAIAIHRARADRLREGDNLRWQSRLFWFLARNTEAEARANAAIEVLQPLGKSAELAMAYSNRSQLAMLADDSESAMRWAEKAIEMATAVGDDAALCHALNNAGVEDVRNGRSDEKLLRSLELALANGYEEHVARAWTNLGTMYARGAQYERARRYLSEGIAWCRERDLDSWILYMRAYSAHVKLETGDWDGAALEAQFVLDHSGGAAVSRIPTLVVLGRIRSRRGDPGAQALLDEALEQARRSNEFQRIAPVAAARAEAAWLRGDLAAVAREAKAAFEMSEGKNEPWMRGELAMWMWRAGALAEPVKGIAEPFRLLIAGKTDEAAGAFEAAGRTYEAESLRRKSAHPSGLTNREVEILTLVDEGLRNADIASRLFVSPKTVDHHVSSILSKLGAKTRGEAAKMFRDQK
jgi:DNA-binding CsgD family transcriptional regulator/tetratricopeptide (TPR) repeat protein